MSKIEHYYKFSILFGFSIATEDHEGSIIKTKLLLRLS